MFGMGFTEILLIAVIAIIALGPEKLPGAMVDIAKFFRKFKSGIEDAKSTLDQELELQKLKDEADKYKSQLTEVQNSVSSHNLERLIDETVDPKLTDLNSDSEIELESSQEKSTIEKEQAKPKKPKKEKVSFKDKKAKIKEEV